MTEVEQIVEQIIEEVARETIGDEIQSVHVVSDLDYDGEKIFRVKIIFESSREDGQLDPNKTTGLVRRILPKLSEEKAEGFPILSFISTSDYKDYRKAHPEFA